MAEFTVIINKTREDSIEEGKLDLTLIDAGSLTKGLDGKTWATQHTGQAASYARKHILIKILQLLCGGKPKNTRANFGFLLHRIFQTSHL